MTTRIFAVAALALTILVGCQSAPGVTDEQKAIDNGAVRLSGAELQEYHAAERHMVFRTPTSSGRVLYRPDGSGHLDWGSGTSDGRWRVHEDMFCTTWTNVRGGAERCLRVYDAGDGGRRSFTQDGAFNSDTRPVS